MMNYEGDNKHRPSKKVLQVASSEQKVHKKNMSFKSNNRTQIIDTTRRIS